MVKIVYGAGILLLWMGCGIPFATAQLPQDVRDVFERMIVDLDEDLAGKFQDAIDKDSPTVEFTPAQFRRFRDDPINPFDGLNRVQADDGGGNIALNFELPSLRGRTILPLERQHESIRESLAAVVGSAAASTVGIFNDKKQIALGIVVDADGLIISKASELEPEESLRCEFADGRSMAAKVVRTDQRNDIALLTVDVSDGTLTPIQWSTAQPRLGAFLITPNFDASVTALGSYSSAVRATVSGAGQAFLGVQPQTMAGGVMIRGVRPGNASYEAGLRNGDIIVKLASHQVRDVTDLVRQIRHQRPGDRIEIEYLRNGHPAKTVAVLAAQNLSGDRAARFKMMNRLGAIPSRRSDGFPSVFQHDTPLFPEQCGGPIVDLRGNVVGMNIARNGRAATYAIPVETLKIVIEKLSASSLALRPTASLQN